MLDAVDVCYKGYAMPSFHDFDKSVQAELLQEDREAWKAIVVILMSIIAVGIAIALLALFLIV